jgi:hypothetical protein
MPNNADLCQWCVRVYFFIMQNAVDLILCRNYLSACFPAIRIMRGYKITMSHEWPHFRQLTNVYDGLGEGAATPNTKKERVFSFD